MTGSSARARPLLVRLPGPAGACRGLPGLPGPAGPACSEPREGSPGWGLSCLSELLREQTNASENLPTSPIRTK